MLVRLGEPAGPHPRTELCHARVLDRQRADVPHGPVRLRVAAATGEQPEEVRLARPVRAEDGDALAVPDLEVEGFISPVSSRSFATIARLAVRPPVRRILTFWCTGIAFGGPGSTNFAKRVWAAWYREAIPSLYVALTLRVCTRPELEVLLVPAPPQLLEPGAAVLAGLGIRRNAPGAPRASRPRHPARGWRCAWRRGRAARDHG